MASRAIATDQRKVEEPTKDVTGDDAAEFVPPAAGEKVAADQIAALAYEYWLQRGCPIGSSELDWFQAEEELKRRAGPTAETD
jgi:hypothetical protein